MFSTINKRIKAILDFVYKGNVTQMAKSTYIKRTTINSIVGSDEVSPRFETIESIANLSSPRISMEWLIRGVGDMYLSGDTSTTINSNNENTNINDSDTIIRLLSLLEEKDKQITHLLKIIENK